MINKVQLIGRTGEDPNYFVTTNGSEIVEFSFATSDRYKDQEETEWHRIKMFGGLATVMKMQGFKGQLLYLEGKIHYSSWEDKEGNKRYSTEIICHNLKILEWKEKVNPWPSH
jgi:single-strand DNA-binding protein